MKKDSLYRKAYTIIAMLMLTLLLVAAGCHPSAKKEMDAKAADEDIYTCPMHSQIKEHKPGNCPICGMALVKKEFTSHEAPQVDLNTLLQPTNSVVVSGIPVTSLQRETKTVMITALGRVDYDTRLVNTIAARISGRIEKLYVKYRYQHIHKGMPVMDIYSPELLTAQQNLLFLLKNDAGNTSLVNAAKQRLLLLGMSSEQLQKVVSTGRTIFAITVYSNYTGHIHEAGAMQEMSTVAKMDVSAQTEALNIKEGMYVTKGQTIFQLFNTDKSWVLLNFFADDAALVKKGTPVTILPETSSDSFTASIDYVELVYRNSSKTVTARVYFDNSNNYIPIGSQVKAMMQMNTGNINWLPKQTVLSLGMDKIVLLKTAGAFKVKQVNTGITTGDFIQVTDGISAQDSVAANAQYLMDSESFIKVNR